MLEIRPIFSALLRHKSSSLLIVLQIAITLAVVVNAIFIINERLDAMSTPSGVKESQIIALNVNPFGSNYNIEQNIREDMSLLRNLPGVVDATAINAIPLGMGGSSSSVSATEQGNASHDNLNVAFYRGDSHIVNTFGVNIVEGSNFSEDDVYYTNGEDSPKVALITQALAERLFENESAVGKILYEGDLEIKIIGVIDHLVSPWVSFATHKMTVVTPVVELQRFKRYVLRVEPESFNRIMGEVEDLLIERNPNRVLFSVRSIADYRQRSYSSDSAMTKILVVVISLLILITALGIVGIVSFNISQRTKQIGTRRALGATTGDIQRYFLTENILLSGLGIALGTLFALGFNIYLVNEYQLSPIAWYYIPIGMVAMLLTGLIAVWFPALKASKVSPAVATQTI